MPEKFQLESLAVDKQPADQSQLKWSVRMSCINPNCVRKLYFFFFFFFFYFLIFYYVTILLFYYFSLYIGPATLPVDRCTQNGRPRHNIFGSAIFACGRQTMLQNFSKHQQNTRVDKIVLALGKEIDGLEGVLDRIQELRNLSNGGIDGPCKQHLENVELSLGQCRETLGELDRIVCNLSNVKATAWKHAKLTWKADEISEFRQEISGSRHRIELDLMMITWYHNNEQNSNQSYSVIANGAKATRVSRHLDEIDIRLDVNDQTVQDKLDKMKDQLITLVQLCRRESQKRTSSLTGSIKSVSDLQETCLRAAEEFVVSRVSAKASSSPENRESDYLSSERESHLGSEVEFTEVDRGIVEEWIPPASEPFGDIDRVSTQVDEVVFPSDADSGIEFDIIQQLLASANKDLGSADYAKAEKQFERVRNDSDKKYGKRYRWRAETSEKLGICYSKQNKWTDAEPLFRELLDPPSPEEKMSFEITHALAEVYLGMGEFERAELFCKQAIEGRGKMLGKDHRFYYRSIKLLAEIYAANGDSIGAEVCKAMLPIDQFNKQRADIEQLMSMKPEDAAAAIGVTVMQHLFPETCNAKAAKWKTITKNILCTRRISGTGHGYALLHGVAKYGEEGAVMVLLEHRTNVNAVDEKGNTALHMAARGVAPNRKRVVEILLEYHADLNMKRKDGRTALLIAVQKDNIEVLCTLVAKKVDLNAKDVLGWTALHHAAFTGNEITTALLLKNGANVDAVGQHGRTALHCAAGGGKEKVARILLLNKASTRHKDKDGQTASDLARKESHHKIVEILRGNARKTLLSGSTLY